MLHRVAATAWPVVVVWLVLVAPPGRARVGALVFGATMQVMLATSAVVHLRRWGVWTTELLFRLDHTAIFLALAGTATPIALLGLAPPWDARVLLAAWGMALLGLVVVWAPAATPAGFANTAFLTMGWVVGLAAPATTARAGGRFLALLVAGGVVYTVGALLVALQRPDPLPGVFGYHEVWHLLVLVALALHTVMVAATLLPLG